MQQAWSRVKSVEVSKISFRLSAIARSDKAWYTLACYNVLSFLGRPQAWETKAAA